MRSMPDLRANFTADYAADILCHRAPDQPAPVDEPVPEPHPHHPQPHPVPVEDPVPDHNPMHGDEAAGQPH